MSNLPDIVVVDKQSMAVVIDAVIEAVICIPNGTSIRKKEHKRPKKHKGMRAEVERM